MSVLISERKSGYRCVCLILPRFRLRIHHRSSCSAAYNSGPLSIPKQSSGRLRCSVPERGGITVLWDENWALKVYLLLHLRGVSRQCYSAPSCAHEAAPERDLVYKSMNANIEPGTPSVLSPNGDQPLCGRPKRSDRYFRIFFSSSKNLTAPA